MSPLGGEPFSRWACAWAAAAVCLGAAVAVVTVLDARARAEVHDARDVRQVAVRAVLPVVEAIRGQKELASSGAAQQTREVAPGDEDGPSAATATLARDTGEPVLDDMGEGFVVTARYDRFPTVTVADRRAALVGYSVTPLDLDATFASLDLGRGSVALLGPTRRVTSSGAAPTDAGDDAVSYQVSLDGSLARTGWRVEAVVPRGSVSSTSWALAALALLGGLAAALLVLRRSVRDLRRRREAARHAQSESMLAELATVAQGSLDLAEVLPSSLAVMESTLDLEGASLLTASSRPSFVWGAAPEDTDPTGPPFGLVPAGSCVELPLARSGRSLGVLRVRAGRELDELDVSTLTSAADTLSSAVANADAYAHQRGLITRMRNLDDLKTVFVATASHELRTPVAAVIGYASLLTENWDDLDSERGLLYAQRVEGNARRLGALVEHLLDFSRLEQGGSYNGEKNPLDLGREVAELIEGQPDLTPDHELLVSVETGLVVCGSQLAIERVLTNLVGNAAKYSPAGSSVRVRVEAGDEVALLVVDDEGPGIPEQEREQIFSRFFRGKGDAVIRTRGAGLGLSIVTEYASSMGGTVSIGSAPGGGARFAVAYPLHEPTGPEDPGTPDAERAAEHAAEPGEVHVPS